MSWTVDKTWRFTWKFAYRAGLFYCAANTIGKNVGELVVCSGPSMYPTIKDGELILAERFSVLNRKLHRGDIVGCLNPHDADQLLCKRIVAKERDYIKYEDSKGNFGRVPRGHFFLLGDNRGASTDSRDFGPVPEGLVQVRLVLRIWPPSRVGWISSHFWWEPEPDSKAKKDWIRPVVQSAEDTSRYQTEP